MMSIIFARHGESEANKQNIISNRDFPHKLTPSGISQAVELAERVAATYNVNKIGTSSILRAKETAAIVANRLCLSYSVYPALNEFDCGGIEGQADEEAWASYRALVQAWHIDKDFDRCIPPDGESFNDMKARFLPFLADLINNHQHHSKDILLITHGGLLHHMLPLIMTNIDQAFIQKHPLSPCDWIIAQPRNGKLFCRNWAGRLLV